jgi:predicted RNase H-like nuclease
MVVIAIDDDTTSIVERVSDLFTVVRLLESGELAVVGIDIPIGLPRRGPRACDVEARRMIGPRRSSVFPAPIRGVLEATTYGEAVARCRALSGKGLSRQAFGLLSKVRDVDRVMTPQRQRHLVEVHPEASFTALAGSPMAHYKKTPAGRAERLGALRTVFPDIDRHAEVRIDGVSPDDVLDAHAVTWSARRWLARAHIQLGGQVDERGLRMEIVA